MHFNFSTTKPPKKKLLVPTPPVVPLPKAPKEAPPGGRPEFPGKTPAAAATSPQPKAWPAGIYPMEKQQGLAFFRVFLGFSMVSMGFLRFWVLGV